MDKENQRVALTRRLLKENLVEILKEKPIGKVSVTELCKRAEVNRSTFYAHYSAPADVFLEIKWDLANQILESLRSMDEKAPPKERFVKVCEVISANAELEKIIFANSADNDVTETAFDHIFETFNVAEPFMREESRDENARRLLTVFFHQGVFQAIREWITREIPKTPAEIAEIFSGILFNQSDGP